MQRPRRTSSLAASVPADFLVGVIDAVVDVSVGGIVGFDEATTDVVVNSLLFLMLMILMMLSECVCVCVCVCVCASMMLVRHFVIISFPNISHRFVLVLVNRVDCLVLVVCITVPEL